MSTKVYDAYQLLPGRTIPGFAQWLRSIALPVAERRLHHILKNLVCAHVASEKRAETRRLMSELRAQAFGREVQKLTAKQLADPFTPFDAGEFVRLSYLAQLATFERSMWNLDAWVSLWEADGHILMRAVDDNMSALNASACVFGLTPRKPILNLLDGRIARAWVRDVSFWNDSERPQSISAREWRRREALWDAQHQNRDTLVVLPIIDKEVVGQLCGAVATTPRMRRFWNRERARYPAELL